MREKARQKFPGLDAEEIRATLHLMDEETASRVTIEQVFPSRDTFFIREKESQ
jgi:hypothetical protein